MSRILDENVARIRRRTMHQRLAVFRSRDHEFVHPLPHSGRIFGFD
jgi:hypothetical protein